MKTELVLALIAQYGIPTALKIVEILKPGQDFTPEMDARLRELGSKTAADYEAGPVA